MNLKTYLSTTKRGGVTELANSLGISVSYLSQMASGKAPIPHDRAVKIEQITNFAVTRREMFPQKWHLVWPELVDDDHQPDIGSLAPEPRAEAVTEQAAAR